jgi:hypothetical protein
MYESVALDCAIALCGYDFIHIVVCFHFLIFLTFLLSTDSVIVFLFTNPYLNREQDATISFQRQSRLTQAGTVLSSFASVSRIFCF